jgi:TonB family protein
MSDVSDILRDRMLEPGGFERMATLSVLAHGVALGVLLFAPGMLGSRQVQSDQPIITINLGGGAAGPATGGLTALSSRPVQELKPPEEAPKREAVRPPAAKTPEMTLPDPKAKPSKTPPAPAVKQAPAEAKGRTPTRGAQPAFGNAMADTGARGQGFGLSSGGPSGSGSYLDVANFCCPAYIQQMVDRIRANWNAQAETAGEVTVKFTVQRDGSLTAIVVERPSGYAGLDINAQRAVVMTRTLNPLPGEFTNPSLTVHLNFQYQR